MGSMITVVFNRAQHVADIPDLQTFLHDPGVYLRTAISLHIHKHTIRNRKIGKGWELKLHKNDTGGVVVDKNGVELIPFEFRLGWQHA